MKFVHLHVHTNIGSPYDALGQPKEVLEHSMKLGMSSIAITDHGNMNSLASAYLYEQELKKAGNQFKYIKGVEFYYIDDIREWEEKYNLYSNPKRQQMLSYYENKLLQDYITTRKHLVVWALNYTGLKNLFRLVSISHQKPYFYKRPRIDFRLLSENCKGLAASSACVSGVLGQFLLNKLFRKEEITQEDIEFIKKEQLKFREVFNGNWFGELQWHNFIYQNFINKIVYDTSLELSIPMITTCDAHYLKKEDILLREAYISTRNVPRKHVSSKKKENLLFDIDLEEEEDDPSVKESNIDLYMKKGEEVYQEFLRQNNMGIFDKEVILESLRNTCYVSDMVEDYLVDTAPRMPSFILDKYNITDSDKEENILRELCLESLRAKKLDTNVEYLQRLEREIELIKRKDFIKYFLTMREIVKKAKEHMGVGVARGSAAGSLVSYLLGITMVDPLKFGLSFSRFLTYDSSGYPDIDFDCEEPKVLKDILIRDWGENKLAYVSNWNLLSFKTVVKDLSKQYWISFEEVNNMTKRAMEEYQKAVGESEFDQNPSVDAILEHSESARLFFEKHPEIKWAVDGLKGCVRDLGRHAGGVIIGDNLFEEMPVIRVGENNQTPWPEGQNSRLLEPMGFIKFDILGISTLSVIFSTIKKILERKGKPSTHEDVMNFYIQKLSPDNLDLNIQAVYNNVFHNGFWAGIFQFSKQGVQEFCKKFCPTNITELSIVTSVYRPGPLQAEVDRKIVLVKNGKAKREDYGCREYAEVTKDTYGFLIFQEQISELMCRILGVSEDEGQKIRKLLTKKKGGDMEKLEPYVKSFYAILRKRGMSEENIGKLWDVVVAFAGYGFNKSHAVSYSLLSYQCAVLATFFKEEWILSVLDVEFPQKRWEIVETVLRNGYQLSKFSLDSITKKWKLEEGFLTPPILAIRGVGETVVEVLEEKRRAGSLNDLYDLYRIYYEKGHGIKKNVIVAMIKAGVFNEFFLKEDVNRWVFLEFLEENKKEIRDRESFYSLIRFLNQKKKSFSFLSMGKMIYELTDLFYPDYIYYSLFSNKKNMEHITPPSQLRMLKDEVYSVPLFVVKCIITRDKASVNYIDEHGRTKGIVFSLNGALKFGEGKMNIIKVKKSIKNNYIVEEVTVIEKDK
ncbi:MAG: DNA polymerase III subunit alpha [Patescibacteria group bacterium]|nr:DNA polymerase III subunit alpha [Patescibacteria group bacterium]